MRIRPRRIGWDDERGATVAIVLISLTAIFGMVALAVDGGGMLVFRRRLVNTADSAALAAALSFARNEGGAQCSDSSTWSQPETWADSAGQGNLASASRVLFTTLDCSGPSGKVQVRYQSPMQLYFAPVLGFDKDKTISAIATAQFGVAGSGQPPPLMLRSGPLKDCWGGSYTPPASASAANPVGCSLWLNNSADDLTQLGNAQWAWVNLDKWGVAATDNCNNAGTSKTVSWITTAYPNPLGFNSSGPTYVCTENGSARPQARALATLVGQIEWFPVNCETQVPNSPCSAPHGQVDKNGALCDPATCSSPDKYDIVGFEPLRVVHVCTAQDSCWGDAIGSAPVPTDPGVGNTTCDVVKDFAVANPVNVLSLNATGCPPTGRAGVIINNDLVQAYQFGSGSFKNTKYFCNPGYVPGVPSAQDYGYDPSTHALTWNPSRITTNCPTQGTGGSSKHVTFIWHVDPITGSPGSAGYCNRFGNADPNAWCLSIQYEGPQAGNQAAGGGYDFGARGINLIDNPPNP